MTKPPATIFALLDCNNFYASCERAFNPKLRKRPIVVLSNNDGCVIARSAEAKALGIPMGAPAFKFQPLFRKHGVAVFSSNFALYGDMSRRVMDTAARFTPDMEIYSIDEAFLRLDRMHDRPLDVARRIRATIQQWTGIPVSIGIGPTKTLAKVANRVAKKHPEHGGAFSLEDHPDRDRILTDIEIEDVWGIGRQYGKKLREFGIRNALQFSRLDKDWVRKRMTVNGMHTLLELQGVPCLPLEQTVATPKSIVCSRTFAGSLTDKDKLAEIISGYAARTGERLRAQGCVAGHLQVFMLTDRFRLDRPQYSNAAVSSLVAPTSRTPDLIRAARKVLDQIFKPGYEYRKAGVMLFGIEKEQGRRLHLFEPSPEERARSKAVMETMDRINAKWGAMTMRLGAEGTGKRWVMRQAHLSPRYTTNWRELPVVRLD
ncbi:DNA polymerase V [Desulfonatronum thiosulfatophilum]|uniref:DNA polymerase V n=1 Tax=Desulfonatronum thiosulfatophilum TaxID=617002 RepID=A0A1G6A2V0_9BACT|nr:Y-family DNA polymerase [Desulfonatronum thiosulfatophilum]SDB02778.1 DNA polymerase V [Desulfonatronum thiosulfatophilum]